MNLLDAAAVVLADAGGVLHYQEIVHRILQRGLWQTEGRTPSRTMNAGLVTDIKKRGPASRFQHLGPGMFTLRPGNAAVVSPERDESTAKSSSTKKMLSFTDAAEHVLEHFGKKHPMHYRHITERALELGVVTTEGKTPEATMYAQILTEIDRNIRRGEPARFVKYGKGLVGLSKWTGVGLGTQIEQHNAAVRKRLHGHLHAMKPDEFEVLVGALLGHLGFAEVTVTSKSGDGGIDVRGTLVVGDVIRTRMAVQVKRWKQNVQKPTVQQVRGSLGAHDQGLIITTSDFSSGAKEEAERSDAIPVALMNGEQFVALLVEHGIGIYRSSYELIELSTNGESEEN